MHVLFSQQVLGYRTLLNAQAAIAFHVLSSGFKVHVGFMFAR